MDAKQGRGRPKKDESRTESVAVRLTPGERKMLLEYRRKQPDLPAESEVLREGMLILFKRSGLL